MSTARVKKTKAKQRSKAKAARQAEREAAKAARLAKWEADYPLRQARWQRSHDARLARETQRARDRKIQYAGIEFICGRDTHDAMWFARYAASHIKADKEARRRSKIAGDPLNLTGHSKRPSTKQQRKIDERERLARGIRFEAIADPEFINQDVLVQTTPIHKRRRSLITTEREYGIAKFEEDLIKSFGSVRSPALEARVDTSMRVDNPVSTIAGNRLDALTKEVGEKSVLWVANYCLLGHTPTSLHRQGGSQHTTGTSRLKEALDDVCAFYDRNFVREDRDLRLLRENVKAAVELIKQGEKDLASSSNGRPRPKSRRSIR